MANTQSTAPGARSALAGYRKQFLYTLHQILCAGARVRVEGWEDLDILDDSGGTVEVIQVKAYDRALTLAPLIDYFDRSAGLLVADLTLRARLVTFGPVGPELRAAWRTQGDERDAVRAKLVARNLAPSDVDILFTRLQIDTVDEDELEAELRAELGQLATAADIEASFDLLMLWIYASAEDSLLLDREELEERIACVGRYVAERSVYTREWFTNIVPITTSALTGGADLEQEYRAGVGARAEHIAAQLDVERPDMMAKIDRAFESAQTVIVRGASGQGKSTLAYRWLFERVRGRLALEIREIRDRQHARELALAIVAYTRVTGVELTILHDVRPGDTTWTELLHELATLASVRLLITVREDDWHRATAKVPLVRFAEVELSFSEAEARELHARLAARGAIPIFNDFEAAWARFGGGPLLEFVYLLTQPTSLRERLRQQLERLSDDEATRPGLLRLLRWAAVADAYGARLDARSAARQLGLAEAGVVFAQLEREYLLRRDGDRLAGVHAVRSQILVELMLARDAGFETWLDTAVAVLPALVERDREVFLLHAFSRQAEVRAALVQALRALDSRTWAGVLGVIRALVWLGVVTFIQRNEVLLEEVLREEGVGWWVFLQADLIDFESVTGEPSTHVIETLGSVTGPRKAQAAAWRERLSEPERALAPARDWLTTAAMPALPPSAELDWDAAALVLFWAGHLDVEFQLDGQWTAALASAFEELDIETLANLNYGAWRLGHDDLLDPYRELLVERCGRELNVIALDEAGPEVRVDYIIEHDRLISNDGAGAKGDDEPLSAWLNAESVRRCEILRGLFPRRERWGAQAVGHQTIFVALGIEHDPSQKLLSPASLPPLELTRYYGAYHRLVELGLRVATWPEWCLKVLEQRARTCEAMEMLLRAVEEYFRQGQPQNIQSGTFDAPRFNRLAEQVWEGMPPFPRCAVDEWGFTGETSTLTPGGRLAAQQLDLRRYDPARKALSDLLRDTRSFLRQARHAIEIQPVMAVARSDEDRRGVSALALKKGLNPEFPRLSLHNLFSAWKQLTCSQEYFRETFAHHIEPAALAELERRERRTYDSIRALWYEFIHSPHRLARKKVKKAASKAMDEALRKLRMKIRAGLSKKDEAMAHAVRVEAVRDDLVESPGLWVVLDHIDLTMALDVLVGHVLEALYSNLPTINSGERQALLAQHAWDSIHIIILTRGRALSDECLRINSGVLMAKGPSLVRRMESIPAPVMTTFKLASWRHPLLEVARHYYRQAVQLRLLSVHLDELVDADAGTRSPSYMERLMSTFKRKSLEFIAEHQRLCGLVSNALEHAEAEVSPHIIDLADSLTSDDIDDIDDIDDADIMSDDEESDDEQTDDDDGFGWVRDHIEDPRPEQVWAATVALVCSG